MDVYLGGYYMEYKKFNDTYVLRLNKGEEVIESLKELCSKEEEVYIT